MNSPPVDNAELSQGKVVLVVLVIFFFFFPEDRLKSGKNMISRRSKKRSILVPK